MSAGNWCLIESDPGVFSELIADLGVRGVQVEELYSMDEASLSAIKPVYGLIFLFKWDKALQSGPCVEYEIPNLFFAQQVIQNACATQAILSVLLNSPEIQIGSDLMELKLFAAELPSEDRGLVLSNSEKLRSVHNSFARQETFDFSSESSGSKDAFHFVAYIPHNGRILELDGLQQGPIDHGRYEGDWLKAAAATIQQRIERYSQSEIRFNLLAVSADRREGLEARLATAKALLASSQNGDPELALTAQAEVQAVEEELRALEERHQKQKAENVRRRFNYIPFMVDLLRGLAKAGRLDELVKSSQQRMVERAKARKEGKEKNDDE